MKKNRLKALIMVLSLALIITFSTGAYAGTYYHCKIEKITEDMNGTMFAFFVDGLGSRAFYLDTTAQVNRMVAIALTAQSQDVEVQVIVDGTPEITGIAITNTP